MANTYECKDCGQLVDGRRCPKCKSYDMRVVRDLHLGVLGIDAYAMVTGTRLIIKKPSGQVVVELKLQDLSGT